jgi:hypothetical protein
VTHSLQSFNKRFLVHDYSPDRCDMPHHLRPHKANDGVIHCKRVCYYKS